jgi:hypothetical protein
MQTLRLRLKSREGEWTFLPDGGGEPKSFDSITDARWEARRQLLSDGMEAAALVYGKQDIERWEPTE